MTAISTPHILKTLGDQIHQCETARRSVWTETFSSGYAQLDRRLPQGGFARGTLIEWLAATGGGAGTLALSAAWQACRDGPALVVVDRRQTFYPPAAAALGVDLEQLIVVRPANRADEAWAVDQALRCGGVGAVLCWPGKLDDRTFRRWQLAAEEGGTLGMLLRPSEARQQPSWAELRLLVAARSSTSPSRAVCRSSTSPSRAVPIAVRSLQIEVLPCRGAKNSRMVELDIDVYSTTTLSQARHESHPLPLAPGVAPATAIAGPAAARRAAHRAV